MKKWVTLLIAAVLLAGLLPGPMTASAETAAEVKSRIKEICEDYGFETNAYWSYNKNTGDPKSYKASGHKAITDSSTALKRAGESGWYGYKFDSGTECWGFASFIGYKLFGQKEPQNGGWTKYTTAEAVREHGVCVGDIIRTKGSPHSAIVYSIKADGTIRFVECWGTRNNIIKFNNKFAGSCDNIEEILNNKYGKFSFLAHAPNNTAKPGWKPKPMEVSVTGYEGEYDGEAHGIEIQVTVPDSGYTILYGKEKGTYDQKKPITYKNAGTYTVYYQIEAPGYYAKTDKYKKTGSAQVIITKKDVYSLVPPEGPDLTYTGEAQPLLTPGSVGGGVMQYSTDGENYSETVPTAVDTGEYTVFYRVVGDRNHNDTEPAAITVRIIDPSRLPGDADGSGSVDAQDALIILRRIGGQDVLVNQQNADVNADGNVDFADAVLILQYVCGWNVTLK